MFKTEGFQKYLKNTAWLFADRVVRLGAVLVTSIFITRYLGPDLFGQLNYASAFVGIFFALTSMGLDDIMARDLVRDPSSRDRILGTALIIKLAGSALLFITVLVLALLKGMDSLTIGMVLLVAGAEFLKPITVIEPFFNSQVKGRVVAKVNMSQAIVSAFFKLAIMFTVPKEQALLPLSAAYIVEMLMLSGGYLVAYRHHGLDHWKWRFDKAICMQLLQQSWPMVVYGLALYVQAKVDQVLIGDMLRGPLGDVKANEEVGQYSAALKMIESLGFVPSVVAASLAPAITRAHQENKELYQHRIVNQYRLMFMLFLGISVPLYFLAEPFMVILFGEEFRPAGYLLSLFAIRLFFTNMGVAKMSFISNEGLFKYSLVTSLVGAASNILLNWLLIPHYHSIGAIWAMIVSFFISNILLDLFYAEARPNLGYTFHAITTFWKLKGVR